jgi:hypothetical protein
MITFQYVVTVNDDGTINTQGMEASDTVTRKPSAYDIYTTSKELYSNIDQQMLADRVAQMVADRLTPADPNAEIKSKLADALRDRGIEPDKN